MALFFPGSTVMHGTPNGYAKHVRDKTPICEPCGIAGRGAQQVRSQDPQLQLVNRTRSNAASKAGVELWHNHPEEYRAFTDEGKALKKKGRLSGSVQTYALTKIRAKYKPEYQRLYAKHRDIALEKLYSEHPELKKS